MENKVLYEEGLRRVQEYQLDEFRRHFKLELINGDDNQETLINQAINILSSEFKLNELSNKIFNKEVGSNFFMKWHCDDCSLFKHRKGHQPLKNNLKLTDQYSLYGVNLPKYSMVIYLSSFGIDFTGGEFNFVDKEIKPMKYDVLFFDSRDIHKVNQVKTGNRKSILIKFYNSDNLN